MSGPGEQSPRNKRLGLDFAGARARVCVVGMGNILYRDEGIGVYAARCLQSCYRFTPEIEVFDGATLGFGLMDLFERATKMIVLDAVAAGAPAGTMYRLSGAALRDLDPSIQPTAHEVEPLELLRLAEAVGEAPDMVLLGIVPADARTMTVGLTPELEAVFGGYVDLALAELSRVGIHAEAIGERSLERTVESLVTRA